MADIYVPPPLSTGISTGPLNIPDVKMPLMIGLGVVGGLAVGSWALKHTFVEGMTSEERKSILKIATSTVIAYAASQLIDIQKAWWLTTDSMAQAAISVINSPTTK